MSHVLERLLVRLSQRGFESKHLLEKLKQQPTWSAGPTAAAVAFAVPGSNALDRQVFRSCAQVMLASEVCVLSISKQHNGEVSFLVFDDADLAEPIEFEEFVTRNYI
jgi:hypothetical protein